ncbi:hypothetical protein RSAG8_02648, partial [Rhizoctonia solani AG-8 WAC10335]
MSISSNGTWIYVADRKLGGQGSDSDIKPTATCRPLAFPVSPRELDKQQELLDFYNNHKGREQTNEAQGSSGQPTGITQSRLVRHLRSMPSIVPKRSGHNKDITVSSTGATVAPCHPENQVQTPAPPPVSVRRRKETSLPPYLKDIISH